MCYNGRALVIAGCVGAVEAVKDELGISRWNYGMRCTEQNAKNKLGGSLTQSSKLSSHCNNNNNNNNSSWISSRSEEEVVLQSREESLKTVMYLNCWAPN